MPEGPEPEPEPEPQPEPEPEPEPAPAPAPEPEAAPSAAARLVELMNQERTERGLVPFAARDDVAAIAGPHSEAMADADDIWHNDAYFTQGTKDALDAQTVGENVAMNADVDDAHRRLMNSSGHRANILNPAFTVVGVGVYRQADGTYFVTEDFVEPRPAPAPSAPAPAGAPASGSTAAGSVETPRGGAIDALDQPGNQSGDDAKAGTHQSAVELAAGADVSDIDLGRWPAGKTAAAGPAQGDGFPFWPAVTLLLLAAAGLAARLVAPSIGPSWRKVRAARPATV